MPFDDIKYEEQKIQMDNPIEWFHFVVVDDVHWIGQLCTNRFISNDAMPSVSSNKMSYVEIRTRHSVSLVK